MSIHKKQLYLLSLMASLTALVMLPRFSNAEWYSESQSVMGTSTGVTLWHADPQVAKALAADVFSEFQRFDQQYSSYKDESELSHVNRQASAKPVQISDEFYELVQQSHYFSELSQGLFDITYAAVGQRYDYRQGVKPNTESLQGALQLVNYQDLELNPKAHTVKFRYTGMQIDLGGIGKGYVIDRAAMMLMDAGIQSAVIYAGGDSRYVGGKGEQPWSVGIRHPRQPDASALVIPMSDTAVSTSGDYERFFIDSAGVRHHHIIHPKTGRSPSGLVSATVIGKEAITTDALSTTLMLAGVKDGLALVETLDDIDAVLIDIDGNVHYSSGLGVPKVSGQDK